MRYNRQTPFRITASSIRWEHIFLYITLEGEQLEAYDYFVGQISGDKYPLRREGDTLILNMVNMPEVQLLPSGKWAFFACRPDTGEMEYIHISPACGYTLEDLDKIYRYSAQNCMYTVTFGIYNGLTVRKKICDVEGDTEGIEIEDSEMFLYVHTNYMRKNLSQARRNVFAETTGWKGRLHGFAVRGVKTVLNLVYRVMFRMRRRTGHNVLLMSETRIPIGGNLKALDDRIRERGLDKQFRMSYSFSKTLEKGNVGVVMNWLRLMWLLAGQDFVFVDDYVPIFQTIDLHRETKLTQLWHAGVGFKSVGYARFGRDGSPHPTDSCHRRYDYAVVGAEGLIPVYEEVFGIDRSRFRAYGLPRLDGYNTPEKREAFCRKFYEDHPELKERKIILFAPTFRGTGQANAYYPMERLDLKRIREMCGDEYAFVIKMHPFVRERARIPEELSDRIYDMSEGTDINELFYVTELLITDFSSNIYEFALQNKPMLFYAYDKDYYQLTRGVHRRLEEFAPGRICETFDEMVEAIEKKDFCEEKREKFIRESLEKHVGYAADRIIDEIILGSGQAQDKE